MKVSPELYCPECNEVYDGEECWNCGHISEELLHPKVKVRKNTKSSEVKEEE